MKIDVQQSRIPDVAATKLRGIALVTGGITAIAGCLGFGVYFIVLPSILVLGALLQPHSPTLGRWLMGFGAGLLTLSVLPYGFGTLFSYRLVGRIDVLALATASVALVLICDTTLVIDLAKRNRARTVPEK